MKKVFRRIAVAGSLAIPSGAGYESSPFEEAAHILQDHCRAAAAEFLGASMMGAIEIDISLAGTADRPTHRENNQKVEEPSDLSGFPTVDEFISNEVEHLQSVELPESGIDIDLSSDEPWELDPAAIDRAFGHALAYRDSSNLLRDQAYECNYQDIFNNGSLDDTGFDVYVFGAGDLCLGQDRVVPRGQDFCTAGGRYRGRSNRILITPGGSTRHDVEMSASSILSHELFGHGAADALGVNPDEAKQREFIAYEIQGFATEHIRQTEDSLLRLEKNE